MKILRLSVSQFTMRAILTAYLLGGDRLCSIGGDQYLTRLTFKVFQTHFFIQHLQRVRKKIV